ncbi:MAG: ABC transporter ATP-binding protein [Planctomycetes bacterium]|nr:ABC transporter ATP-binding protein [Planctomycetota bacterium]
MTPSVPIPLLDVRDLRVQFHTERGPVRAVDGVSLQLFAGRTLGLVGESGCGKSALAQAILRLHPEPPVSYPSGSITIDGRDVLTLDPKALRRVRGGSIGMVFQEPLTSLNPVLRVGHQITEVLHAHRRIARGAARARAIALLERVGFADPARCMRQYPHELSGGMRQRVMLAIALANEPRVLLADEPTTALDVTVQAQILELLRELARRDGLSILLITHDLGVVAQMADDVAVMYAGRLVERASVETLFAAPRHPYTLGLFRSLPKLGGDPERLQGIPGTVPPAHAWPTGCRFRDRCPLAEGRCAEEEPVLRTRDGGSEVACHVV